ncbi:MAG: response regulator transcription factor [Cellulosilyticaceae bacterium]
MMETREFEDSKILLVDDEEEVGALLEAILRKEGFTNIYRTVSSIEAILLCKEIGANLIVLDVDMPDLDGFKVCQNIRKFSLAPIIFLSAKSEDNDKFKGLEIGGDDYITKPFNIKEVVFRIRAHLRRNCYLQEALCPAQKIPIVFGDINIDEETSEVTKKGMPITLTAKEYQLLLMLAQNANKIFSKASLCEKVWGFDYDGYDNTIMVHIRHLREKIEDDPSNPVYIKTVKGLGYKLVKD